VVDGKQPSDKTKVLCDSAIQKLLDEVGLSLLDHAAHWQLVNNLKGDSEWHNITRPEVCSGSHGIQVSSPHCRPTARCCHKEGCIIHITSSWRLGNGVGNMQT
jgi:hypothetical protein